MVTVVRRSVGARSVALVAALLMLAVLLAVDSGLAGVAARAALSLPWRVTALAAGLALLVAGLAAGRPRARPGWTRGELAAVLAVTGAALALRAWQLDALRALIDEGNSIDNLFRAYEPATPLLLPPSQYVTTMLHPAWQALIVAAAGADLRGFRLSSAILGALTVPALWLLARALFDRGTALVAAILLAAFAPHVHFSRVGLPHIMDALFGTLALAGVATGLAGGGRLAWALGGVALGLSHYGFEAGRWFFTPLVAAWLAAQAWLAPARLRAAGAGVWVFAAACAATLVPLYGAALIAGAGVAPRLHTSTLTAAEVAALSADPGALAARLRETTGVYLWQPERAEYYGGESGLLLPSLAPFVGLGVGVALSRPGAAGILVPLWLAAVWAANLAMRDPAVYARWVVSLPALAVAAALGVSTLGAWLSGAGWRPSGAPRAVYASLCLAAVLAVLQVRYYFDGHIERLTEQARAAKPYRDAVDAGLRAAATVPGGAALVISEPPVDVHPVRSLLRLMSREQGETRFDTCAPAEVDGAYLAALPDDRDRAFFVAPQDRATVERLARCFRLAGPYGSPYPVAADKVLDLYLAPRGSRRAACTD